MLFGALLVKRSPHGRASSPSGSAPQIESVPQSIQGTSAATKTPSHSVRPPETIPLPGQEMHMPFADESAQDNESRNSLLAQPFSATHRPDPERARRKCDKCAYFQPPPPVELRGARPPTTHCKNARERGVIHLRPPAGAILRSI